jgi:PPOX class probable F420-dependent enzyme
MDTTTLTDQDAAIFEQKPPLRTLRDDERLALLAGSTSGALATIGRSGYPHQTTVLYAWDPDEQVIRISTRVNRVKAKNAANDSRGSLFVQGPDMWSFVVAEGDLEVSSVSTEPGDATGRELLRVMPQPDAEAEVEFLQTQVDEERVVIRLRVRRLYGDIIELQPPS